jgi:acyl-coenzyme A thioesterase PaaI-like protein
MTVSEKVQSPADKRPQPNSQTCFVCGLSNTVGLKIRFYSANDDTCEARVTFSPEYNSYPGIAHGGIVATVLDETMGRAGLAADPDRLFVTAKMEIKYRQSVPLEQEILFRGHIVKDRGRIIQVEGEVILPDGTTAVEASGTMVQIPPEELARMNTPEVGWRIYEDHEFD